MHRLGVFLVFYKNKCLDIFNKFSKERERRKKFSIIKRFKT